MRNHLAEEALNDDMLHLMKTYKKKFAWKIPEQVEFYNTVFRKYIKISIFFNDLRTYIIDKWLSDFRNM